MSIRAGLSVACMVLLVAACGGGEPEPAAATEAAAAAPAAEPAAEPSLADAVRRALLAAHGEQVRSSYGELPAPQVEPHRQSADGRWVFGGGYFPLPPTAEDMSPVTALFVARRDGDAWEVALEDSPRFAELAQQAPEAVMSGNERRVFAQREAQVRRRMEARPQAVAQDVGLSLPFEKRGAVWGHSGVHGDSGSSRPYNAIDFWGGDGRVLASRGGIAYKFCTRSQWPYIKVVHDNGWTTGYYHLRNQAAIRNGQSIAEGQFIGMIGVELPCGGRASGNHLHWTLWRGSQSGGAHAVNGTLIGGWVWHEGSQPYEGYAERNGTRVYSRNRGLVNYGHGDSEPPPTEPCSGTGCSKYNGTLSSSDRNDFWPGTGGFEFQGGTLKAWLQGPPGADFDLVLGKYNAAFDRWDKVAGSEGPGADESLSYNAGPGRYRWRLNHISGSGAYTLWTQR